MEATLEQMDLKNIDKSEWKAYRFDKIAKSISERVDPTKTDLEVYYGLEHLDSGDIHIKSHGSKSDVKGTKLRCYEGDIIFGRRRAYQRKAAVVEKEGFCSAHSLVLRANPEVIDPKLFPFFLHSDSFMHRAIDISVGSLSPTINWGTLKSQEFLLPPKEQQAELAELLWAMDEVVERQAELRLNIIKNRRASFKPVRLIPEREKLSEYAEVSYGLGQPPPKDEAGVRVIRATNVSKGRITAENLLRVSRSEIPPGKRVELKEGDIIIVRSGAYTGDLAMVTKEWENSVAGYDLVIRLNRSKVDPLWLSEYLLEREAQNYFKGESIRSAQPHLNSQQVKNTLIPIVSIEEQKDMSSKLKAAYYAEKLAMRYVNNSKALQKSLINQIF